MPIADLPDLQAAIARRFRLIEPFGPMEIIPAILPVVQIDPVSVSLTASLEQPAFRSVDIVTAQVANPLINVTLLTTGALAAGTYDVIAQLTGIFGIVGIISLNIFRAAADIPINRFRNNLSNAEPSRISRFALELEAGDEIRYRTDININVGTVIDLTIMARVRP